MIEQLKVWPLFDKTHRSFPHPLRLKGSQRLPKTQAPLLRLSFIAERRKGLRPLRKSRGEKGLHLNAGLSEDRPLWGGSVATTFWVGGWRRGPRLGWGQIFRCREEECEYEGEKKVVKGATIFCASKEENCRVLSLQRFFPPWLTYFYKQIALYFSPPFHIFLTNPKYTQNTQSISETGTKNMPQIQHLTVISLMTASSVPV